MPLSDNGYNVPNFNEARNSINALFQKYFGDDIDLSDSQIEGLLAGILASVLENNEELGQALWKNSFISTATGKNLDDHATDLSLSRNPATPAQVLLIVCCYASDPNSPDVIPEGTEFSTANETVFSTLTDVQIPDTNNIKCYVTDTNLMPDQDSDGKQLTQVPVYVIAEEAGNNGIQYNQIVNPETALDAFYAVTNPNPDDIQNLDFNNYPAATFLVQGTDVETDDQFRQRILNNNTSRPSESTDGIINAVKNIAGVADAKLIVNNTLANIPSDDPNFPVYAPKTHYLYVLGGKDEDIAQTYFEHLVPVANTAGTTSQTVNDVAGRPVTVKFSPADGKLIDVRIWLDVDTDNFDYDSEPQNIINNVLAYFDTLKLGDAVVAAKIFAQAINSAAVKDVQVNIDYQANTHLTNSYQKDYYANINVAPLVLAQTSANQIKLYDMSGNPLAGGQ